MAAEPRPSAPDQRSCEAIVAFLDHVTAFFRSAWALHAGAAGPDDAANQQFLLSLDPAQDSNPISRAMLPLAETGLAATDASADLLRDCIKIGGNLTIRIDRVAALLPSPRKSGSSACKVFCKAWKANDLAVLATRLEHIIHRLCDIDDAAV